MRFIGASATAAGLTLFVPKLAMAELDYSLAHISNPRIIGQADAPIHVVAINHEFHTCHTTFDEHIRKY